MKLSELAQAIEYLRSHGEDDDPEVVIRTMNPSVGPVATTGIHSGFDWDHGKFFIQTAEPVARLRSRSMAESAGSQHAR